jgi:phosphoribosylglycinamide formyltransferase 1
VKCAPAIVASSLPDRATSRAPLRVAVIVSGRGSNLRAIAGACEARRIRAQVALVIADRPEAGALGIARDLGLESTLVPFRDHPDRAAFERALDAELRAHRPDVVALAGFMRILSPEFVIGWEGRMLNIHPSLLPRHAGLHTHRRVLEAGDTEHGASVHYVTHELDGGPVVAQSRLVVRPGDTAESLSARVQATEHILYPRVLGWIADERLAWRNGQVLFDGRALHAPVVEEFA